MSEPTAAAQAADYISALGLQCDPFAAGHDPRFFYAEPGFMQRLDLLTHLTQFSDSLLVVYGAPGSGTTTLLEQFLSHAKENWRVCRCNAAQLDSTERLLQQLAGCFGVAPDGDDLAARLLGQWDDLREVMELPVLLIDDAHRMPAHLLQGLLSLAGDPQATAQRLRIILFGRPELGDALAQAGLAPALVPYVQTLDMPALTETQAAAYLLYRLTVAGYSGQSPFSSTEVRAIAKTAAGLPGAMNALARDALVEHQSRNQAVAGHRPERRGGGLLRLLAAAGAGAAVVVALMWWRLPSDSAAPREVMREQALVLPEPYVGRIESQRSPEPEVATAIPLPAPSSQPQVQPMPVQREVAQVVVEPEPSPGVPEPEPLGGSGTGVAAEHESLAMEEGSESTPEDEAPTLVAAVPAETKERREATAQLPDQQPAPSDQAEEPPVPAGAPAPATPANEAGDAPADEASAASDEDVVAVVAPKPVSAPSGAWPRREEWILSRPGGRYTLQLLGAGNEAALKRYIQRHQLRGDVAYYVRQRDEAPWYTLLYGEFASREAALMGLEGLPLAVRAAKPLPRAFASVAKQIPR